MNILINLLSMLLIGAVLEGGIFGKAKNKLGNVVLFVWKGINAARSYAIPSNPNSTSQQTQRGIMKSMITYCQASLITLIHKFWDPFAVQMSGYNLFIKTNRKPGTTQTAWTDHIIAKGSLPNMPISNHLSATNQTLSWFPDDYPPGLTQNDYICVVFEDPTGKFLELHDNKQLNAAEFILACPGCATGNIYHYFTYREENGVVTHVSNSIKHVIS